MSKYTVVQNLSIAMKQHPPEGMDHKIDELIYDFPSIFWYKNNMVSAIPTCMCYTLIIHLDTSYALIWPAKPISLSHRSF